MALPRFSRFYSRFKAYTPDLRHTSYVLFGFVTWIPAFMFINSHVAELCWINGASMYPYLNTDFNQSKKKDLCVSWKWTRSEGLQRGMIVNFWSPNDPEVQAIKRVIALEGDKVYTRAPYPFPIAEVPMGHVWVEGDGGKRSLDSNTYGPIPKSLIIGKIVYVLLPWSRSGTIRWDQHRSNTKVIKGQGPDILKWR